jgi:hypothetical protein
MMACNDLSLANQGLTEWKEEQTVSRESRRVGAGMYFIRLQLAHLHEGFKVIEAIRRDSVLMDLVQRCDSRSQASFQELERFVPGGANRGEFEQLVGSVRHNLTFHYDESGRLVENSISSLAAEKDHLGSVTRGSTAHLWYFQAADRVVNDAVCFQIWGIPRGADTAVEADKKRCVNSLNATRRASLLFSPGYGLQQLIAGMLSDLI